MTFCTRPFATPTCRDWKRSSSGVSFRCSRGEPHCPRLSRRRGRWPEMDRTVGGGSCCRAHRGGRIMVLDRISDETDDQVGAAADFTYAGAAIAVGKVKADWPGSPRGRGSSALIVDQTDRLPSHWSEVLLSRVAKKFETVEKTVSCGFPA